MDVEPLRRMQRVAVRRDERRERLHEAAVAARVLREDGFDGAVILEPYAQLVESEQALLESIRFLRGVFGAPAQM